MIVMCSSPLLMLKFRTDASGRKPFTMGRNPLERGGISDGWIVRGNTKSKIYELGFARAPLLGRASRLETSGFSDALTSGTWLKTKKRYHAINQYSR